MIRFSNIAVTALLALDLVTGSSLYGQTIAQLPSAEVDRAIAMILRANQLQQQSELGEKARLYEEAATLLPARDPRSSLALRNAASVQRRLRKLPHAMQLLERAAELCGQRGDLVEAADTYVLALFVALETGDRAAARRYIDRAISLAGSPDMPEADRRRILRRISQPATGLGASIPATPTVGRGEYE